MLELAHTGPSAYLYVGQLMIVDVRRLKGQAQVSTKYGYDCGCVWISWALISQRRCIEDKRVCNHHYGLT
jgi:hypothetical protein